VFFLLLELILLIQKLSVIV